MKTNISYLLYKSKTNKKGLCPIRCRITFNNKRKEFSTGLFVSPNNWNRKQQLVKPPEPDEKFVNTQLSLIRQKLNQAFLFLQVKGSPFDVMDIYLQYLGETPKDEMGVMEIYRIYCDRIKKLVGIDIKEVTYKKYLESGKHLGDYIKWKYKRNDIQIKSLKEAFLDDYSYFLKTEKSLAISTLNKAIQRFRKVLKYAVSQEYLNKDPFIMYKPKSVKKKVIFLSRKELTSLEEQVFEIERLDRIRDMFVFCCYTGLGFKEMATLKKEDVYTEFDGKPWIHVRRQKTERVYKLPILKKAQEIIDKYHSESDEMVLPSITNQKFNAYLKEIANLCGIKKRLTHHIARKTFATTVLLYNNVPMEIVSKLLGHSKIQTTQKHYGHILDKSVSEQMRRIESKLKS